LACFLPYGKAEDTASPSLPRVRSSTLQRHPWAPWSYSILNFCNDRVNVAGKKLEFTGGTMELKSRQEKEATIVSVTGRIDAVTSPELETYLTEAAEGDAKRLIINFDELDYISSAGLRVILMLAKKMKAKQREFILVGVKGRIKQVFEMSGISSILNIRDTEGDALERA